TASASEHRTDVALRLSAGATLHFGDRLQPTLTGFLGFQHRWLTGTDYVNDEGMVVTLVPPPTKSTNELLIGVGVRLEYRLPSTWSIGASLLFVHGFSTGGQSYNSAELPLSGSAHWYPRWFTSTDYLPGGRPLE